MSFLKPLSLIRLLILDYSVDRGDIKELKGDGTHFQDTKQQSKSPNQKAPCFLTNDATMILLK